MLLPVLLALYAVTIDSIDNPRWISVRPRVLHISGLLDAAECEHIIAMGDLTVTPFNKTLQSGRRSEAAFLPIVQRRDSVIRRLEEALAMHARLPMDHGEPLQLQRYRQKGHYTLHHDAFVMRAANGSFVAAPSSNSQRIVTALVYLSTIPVGGGGHTVFPGHSIQAAPWIDHSSSGGLEFCSEGATLAAAARPVCGDAIIFFPASPDGSPDGHSLHGSCPVLNGHTKWVAQKWFRARMHAPEDDTSLWGYWPLTSPLLKLNITEVGGGGTRGHGGTNGITLRGGEGADNAAGEGAYGITGASQPRLGVERALWNLSLDGPLSAFAGTAMGISRHGITLGVQPMLATQQPMLATQPWGSTWGDHMQPRSSKSPMPAGGTMAIRLVLPRAGMEGALLQTSFVVGSRTFAGSALRVAPHGIQWRTTSEAAWREVAMDASQKWRHVLLSVSSVQMAMGINAHCIGRLYVDGALTATSQDQAAPGWGCEVAETRGAVVNVSLGGSEGSQGIVIRDIFLFGRSLHADEVHTVYREHTSVGAWESFNLQQQTVLHK